VHKRFEKSYKLDTHTALFGETPHTPPVPSGAIRGIEDLGKKPVPTDYAFPLPRSLPLSALLKQSDTGDQMPVNPLLWLDL
jgi:hypothetical protein